MAELTLHDKIDRYLEGLMEEMEREAFEAELVKNATLREEVQKHRLEGEALTQLLENDYAAKIKMWSAPVFERIRKEEHSPKKGISRLLYPNLLRYAATFTGLLVLAGPFLWSNLRFTDSAILRQNYIDPQQELLSGFKGTNAQPGTPEPLQSVFDAVKTAYQKGDYTSGIALLKESRSDSEASLYFLGHLYFARGDFPDALSAFGKVIDRNGSLRAKAEYYSLLVLLKNRQTDAGFNRLLDALCTDTEHPYHLQAIHIRQSLGAFWRKLVW